MGHHKSVEADWGKQQDPYQQYQNYSAPPPWETKPAPWKKEMQGRKVKRSASPGVDTRGKQKRHKGAKQGGKGDDRAPEEKGDQAAPPTLITTALSIATEPTPKSASQAAPASGPARPFGIQNWRWEPALVCQAKILGEHYAWDKETIWKVLRGDSRLDMPLGNVADIDDDLRCAQERLLIAFDSYSKAVGKAKGKPKANKGKRKVHP